MALKSCTVGDVAASMRGFTLVETLVALSIMSVVLAAVAGSYGFGVQGPARAEDVVRLAFMREGLMFDLRGQRDMRAGVMSGELDAVAWRVDVNALPGASSESRFRPMSVDARVWVGRTTLVGDAIILTAGGP